MMGFDLQQCNTDSSEILAGPAHRGGRARGGFVWRSAAARQQVLNRATGIWVCLFEGIKVAIKGHQKETLGCHISSYLISLGCSRAILARFPAIMEHRKVSED